MHWLSFPLPKLFLTRFPPLLRPRGLNPINKAAHAASLSLEEMQLAGGGRPKSEFMAEIRSSPPWPFSFFCTLACLRISLPPLGHNYTTCVVPFGQGEGGGGKTHYFGPFFFSLQQRDSRDFGVCVSVDMGGHRLRAGGADTILSPLSFSPFISFSSSFMGFLSKGGYSGVIAAGFDTTKE